MQRISTRHRPRPGKFVPRLEALEDRRCLSCTVFQEGSTLFVLGDRQADDIAIVDRGPRVGVTVACPSDPNLPTTFAGVERILVRTFGGDDVVHHTVETQDPTNWPADLNVDLGAGNDSIVIDWSGPARPGEVDPTNPNRPASFQIFAGQGDDSVQARVGFDPQPDPPGEPWSFSLLADLGAGNDTFEATTSGQPNGEIPAGHVQLDVLGQQGDDRLSLLIGGGEGPSPHMFTALEANFDGGAGNDVIMFDAINVAIVDPVALNVFGGQGADEVGIHFRNVAVNGNTAVNVNGGGAGDAVDILIENTDVAAGGALAVTRTQSDGPDNIAFRANRLNVALDALFELNLGGGRGADTIMMVMEGGMIDGAARIMLDGGRGNDMIDAHVQVDRASRGTLDVAVLGGLGDDELSLAIFGIDAEMLDALVDGGPGYDVAFVTPGVRVRNCEEVNSIER